MNLMTQSKKGAPRPDVNSVDGLRNALLAAKSIGYSEGASGVYVSSQLLAKLAIADQVASGMKKIAGELVGDAIARGEVEIGLQQVSELKAVAALASSALYPRRFNMLVSSASQSPKVPRIRRLPIPWQSSCCPTIPRLGSLTAGWIRLEVNDQTAQQKCVRWLPR